MGNQNNKKLKIWVLSECVILVFLSAGLSLFCGGCGNREPLNLIIAKDHVEQYYECGQYDRDLDKVVKGAIQHFSKISSYNRATVVFDIDETVLNGYVNERSISFGLISKLFHEWILRADAPAIKQTKELYEYLVDRGFIIIFLTGRRYDEYDATMKNLFQQGFTRFEKLIVRQKGEENLSAQAYKAGHRRQLNQEGYDIVGCVGDQVSDCAGGCSGYIVKLPNVRYIIP